MNLRILGAGAAMLAGLTVATSPSQACDSRFGATCEPAAPAEAAATVPPLPIQPAVHGRKHRLAKGEPEPAKAHHGKRARLALARHRGRPASEPTEAGPEIVAPARVEALAPVYEETSAAKRFREFLNPQSFALAVNENLRRPRLVAAHFSGEAADPDVIATTSTAPAEPAAQEDAAPIVAHGQTTGDDSPSTAPVLTHNDAAAAVRATRTEQPARMSFVRWFFVAWGGVLTLASAVRMAVG